MFQNMLIIGEKISVIAKKVREALQKLDPKPLQDLAVAQSKAGAHFIDVSIGPAEENGPKLMDWAVKVVQEVVEKPLCLDTTNIAAMEAGLKAHNNKWGVPIVNSTSNEPERFPMMELAGKYNAKIIALTLGKGSIPADAEDRCVIAAEIMARGMEFGIPMENIFLDPLILQLCTMQDQGRQALRAIKMFRELNDPPMNTVVGLSNISNGAPKHVRPIINRNFLAMLMYEGLSSAIIDPLDKDMMDTVKTVEMILGKKMYAHSYLDM
jgi:5-methyltetrahydrofolate corrinoid/iron sulfur protein methyltransferase